MKPKMGYQSENVKDCGCSCTQRYCSTSTTPPSQDAKLPQIDVPCQPRPATKTVECQTPAAFLSGSFVPQSSAQSKSILSHRKKKKIAALLPLLQLPQEDATSPNSTMSILTRSGSHTTHTRLNLSIKKYRIKKSSKKCPGKIIKKYKKSRIHRVKREEYNKLREMVPSLQEKRKVSKVVVIEETVKYIDELHSALIQRFRAKGVPLTFNGVQLEPREIHDGNIRDLIRRMLANANPSSLPPAKIENVRTLPSFLQKLGRPKKS